MEFNEVTTTYHEWVSTDGSIRMMPNSSIHRPEIEAKIRDLRWLRLSDNVRELDEHTVFKMIVYNAINNNKMTVKECSEWSGWTLYRVRKAKQNAAALVEWIQLGQHPWAGDQ